MNKQKSFTLIELLVVIVIIGILAGVIMISTSSSIQKANIAKVKVFEESIQNNLAANMVSAWDADHVTKDTTWTLNDKWGNNNGTFYDGTVTACSSSACPQIINDKQMGNVLSFDGIDDGIDLGDKSDLNLTSSATISLWLYIPSSWTVGTLYPNIISKGAARGWDTDGWSLYVFRADDKRIGLTVRNGSIINKVDFKNTIYDSWMHIVGFWSGNKIKIYQNGTEKNSIDQTINPPVTETVVSIGKDIKDSSHFFNGFVNDIKIYNAALSSSQIKQNYIAGLNSMLANRNISKEDYNERINALAYDN